MIQKVRLEDSKGRDGLVWLLSPPSTAKLEFRAPDSGPVHFERILKSPMEQSDKSLRRRYKDDDSLARALINGDPEIDMRAVGRIAGSCDRVWIDQEGTSLYSATIMEIVYGPDGVEKERRAPIDVEANIGEDMPLRCTDRFFSR